MQSDQEIKKSLVEVIGKKSFNQSFHDVFENIRSDLLKAFGQVQPDFEIFQSIADKIIKMHRLPEALKIGTSMPQISTSTFGFFNQSKSLEGPKPEEKKLDTNNTPKKPGNN